MCVSVSKCVCMCVCVGSVCDLGFSTESSCSKEFSRAYRELRGVTLKTQGDSLISVKNSSRAWDTFWALDHVVWERVIGYSRGVLSMLQRHFAKWWNTLWKTESARKEGLLGGKKNFLEVDHFNWKNRLGGSSKDLIHQQWSLSPKYIPLLHSLALEGARLPICAALKHNRSGICVYCANGFWEIDGFLFLWQSAASIDMHAKANSYMADI